MTLQIFAGLANMNFLFLLNIFHVLNAEAPVEAAGHQLDVIWSLGNSRRTWASFRTLSSTSTLSRPGS
jgi:hypothetical protein